MNRLGVTSQLVTCLSLAACTTPEPNRDLLASAVQPAGAPSTISGPDVEQCVADVGFFGKVTEAQGTYNPGLTYTLADRIHRIGKDDGPVYAKRLRAYEVRVVSTGAVFGGTDHVSCYYDLNGGKLTYLTMLKPNPDGRVPSIELQNATLKAYCKAKGATRTQMLLTGC